MATGAKVKVKVIVVEVALEEEPGVWLRMDILPGESPRMTLLPKGGEAGKDFRFLGSKPEMVTKIGQLLIRASNVAEEINGNLARLSGV